MRLTLNYGDTFETVDGEADATLRRAIQTANRTGRRVGVLNARRRKIAIILPDPAWNPTRP